MVFIQHNKYCSTCKCDTYFINGKCNKCLSKKSEEQERIWQALDIETKIERLRAEIKELKRQITPPRY